MSTWTEQRWLGYETCPDGGGIHVLPMTISSGRPLTSLETPGNITDSEPCPACCPAARPDARHEQGAL